MADHWCFRMAIEQIGWLVDTRPRSILCTTTKSTSLSRILPCILTDWLSSVSSLRYSFSLPLNSFDEMVSICLFDWWGCFRINWAVNDSNQVIDWRLERKTTKGSSPLPPRWNMSWKRATSRFWRRLRRWWISYRHPDPNSIVIQDLWLRLAVRRSSRGPFLTRQSSFRICRYLAPIIRFWNFQLESNWLTRVQDLFMLELVPSFHINKDGNRFIFIAAMKFHSIQIDTSVLKTGAVFTSE